ncbi:MAG: hypothetical protein P0Y53_03170 [Candidatus Pseudobacter hemicellulosilyticus]|uniref:DUF4397 domain-containing protein n=1 Tax=Candidatus Pseudobacter hemicellulosilyticus TaxID=3121375 RepID=A0AAJ5WTJ1_9BACT|nr:MAG: hypothetical protein P0Y53_03170 [Pseudobacter sp.]
MLSSHILFQPSRGGRLLIFLLLLASLSAGCKKNSVHEDNPAVLQLLNAMDNGLELRTNYAGQHPITYYTALKLWNKQFGPFNTNYISQFPQPLALYGEADTLEKSIPVLDLQLELEPGGIYSLFVYGSKTDPGNLLHKDVHPVGNFADSLSFIRVVNLCPDQSISVNLKGQPAGSTAGQVDFRGVSEFAGHRITASTLSLEFEVRDAATGSLLTSLTTDPVQNNYGGKNLYINKSNSLVFVGRKDGTGVNAPQLLLMVHSY